MNEAPKMTTGLLVALALAGAAVQGQEAGPAPGVAQQQETLPAFPSRVEVVTLDVVVVDKQGRPVRGLAAADFAVHEEGQPQVVVAFEAVDLGTSAGRAPTTDDPGVGSGRPASTGPDVSASNPRHKADRPERAFVFIIDDLGLDFGPTIGVKKAIAHWLTTEASPADEVTLVTTSGDLSWNDHVATGREDLLGILGRVKGGRHKTPFVLSLREAYLINETPVGDRRMPGPGEPDDGGVVPGDLMGPQTLLARLVKRAADAGACMTPPPAACEVIVRNAARDLYDRVARSSRAILGGVERLSSFMGPTGGRKSIVVFSESFLRGENRAEEEAALRASQAANTAVYLVDAKGLVADPFFSAATPGRPDPVDLGTQSLDGGFLDAEYLADATGGRILRNNNDLTSGLGRILDESSIYYRLGYQPEKAPDGRWRRLKVEVRRRNVAVRTRRGYYASPPPAVAAVTPSPSQPAPPPAAEVRKPARPAAHAVLPETPAAPAPDPVLATILEKAGDYVVGFGEAFRDVVVEETYLQWLANAGAPRRSKADLVYVSIPGAISWTCFRDVFEVNGQRVHDHEARLEKLFLAESRSTALQKADAIILASAQHNLGTQRTVNVPTLPLLFLHPENQHRFRFERKGHRRFGDREAVEIALAEVRKPTLVNDGEGGNVPASGRVFVDPRDGVVLRTEIHLQPAQTIAYLVTDYRFQPGLGLFLPAEMTEQYRDPRNKAIDTEASATYAKYRRFGVTTEESVTLPPN
jgi:VWFA-related protein